MERFYGIELAQMSGLDATIVEEAKNIAVKLSNASWPTEEGNGPVSEAAEISLKRAKYRLAATLLHLITKKQQKLDIELIRRFQCDFEGMMQN